MYGFNVSGHNMTLSGLGGLLLVFGLIAQNSAELGHISIQGRANHTIHRRRINSEEKSNVVAAVSGTEFTQLLATLAIFH